MIDLVHVQNDRVSVELKTPRIQKPTIEFEFPKMVPGMYSIDDFGRYILNLKAFNSKGDTLPVVKNEVDSWTIQQADKLDRISYQVSPSFPDTTTHQLIFEPGGSDIEAGKVFVINSHCFLGYFADMKNIPFHITIQHEAGMYGSTALTDEDASATTDHFTTESYNRIVDNPFMYSKPDTAVIRVGKTKVLISVYSPHKQVTANFLARKLDTVLMAQTKYLGGQLPVSQYAFIVYLDDKPGVSGGQGALEHSYSSMYYFEEADSNTLSGYFVGAAAHEFFHIITPLSIHSEEIQDFNFQHPKMSEHLWLYEGTTEYHANMVQEKYGLITADQLLKTLGNMITTAKSHYNDTLALTAISHDVLDKYKDEFINFYFRGALNAMCLDITLLKWSNGKYGLMNLIQGLSEKFGKNKAFRDAELFDAIGKLTSPEIESYLNTYVGGNHALPLAGIFNEVGVSYQPLVETRDSTFSLGGVSLNFNMTAGRLYVRDTTGMNKTGYALGYRINDEIVSINGKVLNAGNGRELLHDFANGMKPGDPLVVQVNRKINGADSLVDLKASLEKYPVFKKNVLAFMPDASVSQLALRKAWLEPNGIQVKR